MTDYELIDVFTSCIGLMINIFMAFISVTSAFLIVLFLAGDELPVFLKKLITAIYCAAGIFVIAIFHRTFTMQIDVRDQMGPSLAWHTGVYEPQWLMPAVMYIGIAIMLMLFIGALWYLIHSGKAKT
jgi:hypothetical protein